ncbi:MAG TPA: transporter substrate-binding domain-containing protein [Candidatus Enterocloster excrementipullorum]|uniref:Transporter substrate-binding domain-containing protein n=1 Tax=Candidatus Enterocloster excrementipullorum TaxID=2838559 RepID=A0A9D2MWI7_9FIRM|nr:transporter substrate-binding domain-containing protein [Candidatus Enterocloster excrementipullorum]
MKKKFLAVTLSALMAASLAACSGGQAETTAAETTAAAAETAESAESSEAAETEAGAESAEAESAAAAVETVTEGKLTVATSPDFAPYEFYAIGEDGTPTLAGFDMALAQYIADYMGLELEVITVDFDGVLSELQTKSVDLGMAGLSPDPKRENIMNFSDIYYTGGQSLVTVKANAETYNSFEAINKPDVSVGAQTGSIQLDLANTNSPDADIISLPKVTDIIAELLAGKLDAAYIETVVAESYQKNYPDLEIVMDVPYDVAGSAIGVSKDNDALLAAVNEAIAAAIEDGSMDAFVAEANELASGQTYEGLLDAEGNVQTQE